MKRVLEIAERWLATKTITYDGNEVATGILQDWMKDRGMKTLVQQVQLAQDGGAKKQFNCLGILGDPLVDRKTQKGLLFVAGIDTPGPAMGPPARHGIIDGRLYGVGAANSKLALVAMMSAVEKFREKKIRQPIYLAATCGKESGYFGSQYLIKSYALNPKYVLVSEPTEGQVVSRHRGQAVFTLRMHYQAIEKDARGFNRRMRVVAKGRRVYGAYEKHGRHAVELLAELIRSARESGFLMKTVHFSGGKLQDAIPDDCELVFHLIHHQFEDFKKFFTSFTIENDAEQNLEYEILSTEETGVKFIPEAALVAMFDWVQTMHQNKESARALGVLYNWNRIETSGQHCEFGMTYWFEESESFGKCEAQLKAGVKHIAGQFPAIRFTLTKERISPPLERSETGGSADWGAFCEELAGRPPHVGIAPLCTEASYFQKAGYPVVVWGMGRPELSKLVPEESLSLLELEKSVLFYEKLIEKVCL